MRVHFCLVASHKNRTAEGNSQGTMRGSGCRYRHQRASGISGFLREEDVHSAATIHARNLVNLAGARFRGSAFGYRTCMVSVPMPILFVPVFFAGSGSASFFSPHDLSETDIKCNIFNAISILYTGIYNCQSRKREEIGGRKKVNSTMYLYIIIYNF